MPIHVRAEPGDYAEACLLPGDPLRAKYIAETFMSDVKQTNGERGMLGYTGTFNGRPVSVQSTGMGCPSAAIVIEELIQLGVKKLVRVGTCGGLQPDLALGDLIVALSAVPADGTARHYVGGEPHAPTADFELVHAAVHSAKELGKRVRDRADRLERRLLRPGQGPRRALVGARHPGASRWRPPSSSRSARCARCRPRCLLTVSDVIVEGDFIRISDEELRAAVDQMTELALGTVTAQ